MNRFFGKFDFIHRRLWDQDGLYRVALLFGPAPLVGCLIAAAVWSGVQAVEKMIYQPPPWAVVHSPTIADSADGQTPRKVQPAAPLPAMNADGSLTGREAGWRVTAHPIQVSATMDVDVLPSTLSTFSSFTLDAPGVDMARIISAGPESSLYVGTGAGLLVVRAPGVYALTARLERPAGQPANCLTRMGFGPGRIVSTLSIGLANNFSKTFEATRFDLQPGLYPISWAFGCWHGQEMIGPGRMTVLVEHPGDDVPMPARSDDIVR